MENTTRRLRGPGMRPPHSVNTAVQKGVQLLFALPLTVGTGVVFAQSSTANEHVEEMVISGQFISSGSASAMKLDVPVRDTPFSVANYTDAFMTSIESSNVSDLYKYMTGIQRAGNTGYDMSIRGFKTGVNDRNAIMVDGLPGLAGRLGSSPTIGTDHIEVVKGPASVLYGQAQPGGFVNLVTKKPSAVRSATIGLKATTYSGDKLHFGDKSGYDGTVDFTGPIDDQKRFLYRFVADRNDSDTYRDFGYEKILYIAPSVAWNILPTTLATLALEYRDAKTSYDKFLVVPNKDISLLAPITTLYQEPGDTQKETGKTASLSLTHEFDSGAKWNFGYRAVWTDDQSIGYDPVAVRPDLVTLSRRARWIEGQRRYSYADTNLVLPFDTGAIKHKAILGISGGRDSVKTVRKQFFNGPQTGPQSLDISIYNPIYGVSPPLSALPAVNPATPNNLFVSTPRNSAFGAYLSDLITLSSHWKLNLGLRYAKEGQRIDDALLNRTTIKESSKFLPLGGILYQPTDRWTYYLSYSTSFVPVAPNSVDVNGNNPFNPTSGKQVEFGVKGDLWDGRLQPTLSVFRIQRRDVLNTFSCPIGTCSQQIGGEEAKGVEFELNAQPVEHWQIALGLAHTDPKITASNDAAQVGAQLQNAAKDSAHFWTRYDLKSGALKNFGIGAGLSYVSERAGNIPTTADRRIIRLPAYSVADLAFYYSRPSVDFTLKFANLFDKRYYENTGSQPEVQVQPGAPRGIVLTARMHF